MVASCCLIAGGAFHFLHEQTYGVRVAGALGAHASHCVAIKICCAVDYSVYISAGVALKWFRSVDYLRSFKATGSLVRMIAVILADMLPFLTVLSITVLGATFFFLINAPFSDLFEFHSDSVGVLWPLLTVFQTMLGLQGGVIIDETTTGGVIAMLVFFMCFVVIVLMNMLIAIMGDSYEKVKEGETVEALRERATIIVEMEKRHPGWHKFHTYLHYIHPVDEYKQNLSSEWQGVANRVQQMLSAQSHAQSEELQKVIEAQDEKIAAVHKEIQNLSTQVGELLSRL